MKCPNTAVGWIGKRRWSGRRGACAGITYFLHSSDTRVSIASRMHIISIYLSMKTCFYSACSLNDIIRLLKNPSFLFFCLGLSPVRQLRNPRNYRFGQTSCLSLLTLPIRRRNRISREPCRFSNALALLIERSGFEH